MIKKR